MAKHTKITTRELVKFAAWLSANNVRMTTKGEYYVSSKEEKAVTKLAPDLLVSYYYLKTKQGKL